MTADPLTFRNNTIFKIYEQAWLMLGIAGGVSLARLLAPLLLPRRALCPGCPRRDPRVGSRAGGVAAPRGAAPRAAGLAAGCGPG